MASFLDPHSSSVRFGLEIHGTTGFKQDFPLVQSFNDILNQGIIRYICTDSDCSVLNFVS